MNSSLPKDTRPRPGRVAARFAAALLALAVAACSAVPTLGGLGRSTPAPVAEAAPVMAALQMPSGGSMQATMVGHQYRQDDLPAIATAIACWNAKCHFIFSVSQFHHAAMRPRLASFKLSSAALINSAASCGTIALP